MGSISRSNSMFALLITLLSSYLLGVAAADVASASFQRSASWGTMSVAVNVPSNSTTNDDLHFSFSAPSKDRQWAAFVMGSSMGRSLMFVVYKADNNGGPPTVSVRTANGYTMPTEHTDTVVHMEAGSSTANDTFKANFYCTKCRSWPGGTLDVKSVATRFYFVMGPDQDLVSKDTNVQISQHPELPLPFDLDISEANGPGGIPVLGSGSDDSQDGYGEPAGVSAAVAYHILAMVGAFLFIFPGGFLFLRLFNKVWLHWGIQSCGLIVVLTGAAAGITAAVKQGIHPKLDHPHEIFGLIIVGLALSTWTIGFLSHRIYKKSGVPSPMMKGHRVLGPLTIMSGLVNCCVGFSFAGRPRLIIFFSIATLAMFIFVGGIVFIKAKRDRSRRAMTSAAANNFREAEYPPPPQYYPPQGAAVPMQTFSSQPQSQQHGDVERYHVQPK